MNEDEQAREQKLSELKKRLVEQKIAEQQALEAESKINSALMQLLSEEAKARLSNVRLVNRELYSAAVQNLIWLAKNGYIKQKVSEGQMKQLLEKLNVKREIKIKRK
ncbi:MAG: DNA-binding protein [Candidatus Diapherotrites archaeon]